MRVSPPTVRTGRAAPGSPRSGATGAPIDPEARLATLLDRQLWCFGRDIRRADNLLLAHGFERRRPAPGAAGGSAYRRELPGGRTVGLWGFALFFGAAGLGGIFIARRESVPRLTVRSRPDPDLWVARDLPPRSPLRAPADRARAEALRGGLLAWIGGYERWALERIGADARRRDLVEWPGAGAGDPGPPADWDALTAAASSVRREPAPPRTGRGGELGSRGSDVDPPGADR